MAALLKRPWFSRIWVIHEVAVAREAIMILGSRQSLSEAKALPMQGLIEILKPTFQGVFSRAIDRQDSFREVTKGTLVGLHSLIHFALAAHVAANWSLSPGAERLPIRAMLLYTLQHEASDPRDRVFSWYGIAKDLDDLKPDYSLSLSEVYAAVTKMGMQLEGKLCGFWWDRADPRMSSDEPEVPSWVPEYHNLQGQSMNPISKDTYRICGDMKPTEDRPLFVSDESDHRALGLHGFRVDVIVAVSSVAPESFQKAGLAVITSLLEELKKFSDASPDKEYAPDGSTRWEAFWKTILADIPVSGLHEEDPEDPTHETWVLRKFGTHNRRLRSSDGCVPLANSEEEMELVRAVTAAQISLCNQRLCTTSRGLLGLVPKTAQVGDIICACIGAEALFLLRPFADQGVYAFVGHWSVRVPPTSVSPLTSQLCSRLHGWRSC